MKTYIEITDFVNNSRQLNMTGCGRVDYNIAKYYFDLNSDRINFITWSDFQKRFVLLTRQELSEIFQTSLQAKASTSLGQASIYSQQVYFKKRSPKKRIRQDSLEFDHAQSQAWVRVRVKNTGQMTWLKGKTYLTADIPSRSFLFHPSWQGQRRVLSLPRDVLPNRLATLKFLITIPASESYLEEFFRLTGPDQQTIVNGRLRVELINRTKPGSRLALKAKIFAIKFKNRLAILLAQLSGQTSLLSQIGLIARKSKSLLQAKLKRQRFILVHRHLFLKVQMAIDRCQASLIRLIKFLFSSLSSLLAYPRLLFQKVFLPWTLAPVCKVEAGDLVFSLTNFLTDDPRYCRHLIKFTASRARLIQFIHDMIPIQLPQFTRPKVTRNFTDYYRAVLPHASALVTTSDNNIKDIKRQLKAWRIPGKKIIKLPLSNDLTKFDRAGRPAGVKFQDYVIYISTIEMRKNHNLLAQTYRLANERGVNLPHLYVVGRQGWLTEDFMHLIRHDLVLKKKISHLGVVSEPELAWLYQNTRYTLYPSHYEGWGLPVGESLAYGCVTLCAETSSLPEVAGDLADYFSPHSSKELLALMVKYQDDKVLNERRRDIRENYRQDDWQTNIEKLDRQVRKFFKLEASS